MSLTHCGNVDSKSQLHSGVLQIEQHNSHLSLLSLTSRSIHWFNNLALPLRVTGQDLDNQQPQRSASSMQKEEFIPDRNLHLQLLNDLIPLATRVIVDNLKAFGLFQSLAVRHIPHKYSKEMSTKSEEVYIIMGSVFKHNVIFKIDGRQK